MTSAQSALMSKQTNSIPGSSRRETGFTLVELIIAMVIVGILVALAFPSFMGAIRKGRRSEAMAALTSMQQEQERWRSNNQSYASTLADLRVSTPTRPSGYYSISILSDSATGYVVMADGTGSSQANDGDCAKLAIKADRSTITYASCRSCASADLAFSATNQCWSR